MKIPNKYPFWIKAIHPSFKKELLFQIIRKLSNNRKVPYWGHMVETKKILLGYMISNSYEAFKKYDGNYGFTVEDIKKARKPTKKEIKKGEKLLKKWEEKALIEDI